VIRERPVQRYSEEQYLGSEQKGRVLLLWLAFNSRLASLLLRWMTAETVFVVLKFSFQVWRYTSTVAMSLLRRVVASGGAVVPGPPFEIGAPPFHGWPTGCCIHPILYFKMRPPFWFMAPPSGFWPPCC